MPHIDNEPYEVFYLKCRACGKERLPQQCVLGPDLNYRCRECGGLCEDTGYRPATWVSVAAYIVRRGGGEEAVRICASVRCFNFVADANPDTEHDVGAYIERLEHRHINDKHVHIVVLEEQMPPVVLPEHKQNQH